jgi:hypothetical protein
MKTSLLARFVPSGRRGAQADDLRLFRRERLEVPLHPGAHQAGRAIHESGPLGVFIQEGVNGRRKLARVVGRLGNLG